MEPSVGSERSRLASLVHSWQARPLRFFVATAVLALVAAGGERLFAQLRSRFAEPSVGAHWIWAEGDHSSGEPIAFYALREIELEVVEPTQIAIAADETYILYVNGQRVGSGSYRPKAPVDEYEVSDMLRVGLNRFLVELRSNRGAGGLLAEIEVGVPEGREPSRIISTDAEWQIVRRFYPGLFGGWAVLENGEAPRVWRAPPTGRWRLGSRRQLEVMLPLHLPSLPRVAPLRVRAQHKASWFEVGEVERRIPSVGPKQLYDWGEEVEGFLSFDLSSAEGHPGLLYFGSEPPDPALSPPDAVLLIVPGRRYWEAAYPRRFRYLLLIGAEPHRFIAVDSSESIRDRVATPPDMQPAGVFGLRPPRSYSKVEEDVWGRLTEQSQEES